MPACSTTLSPDIQVHPGVVPGDGVELVWQEKRSPESEMINIADFHEFFMIRPRRSFPRSFEADDIPGLGQLSTTRAAGNG
jgi:hypothetical protein